MKRSSPLRVDQLEDRCVPATDVLAQTTAPLVAVQTAVLKPDTSFVIDPPLIDPNAPGTSQPPPSNSGTSPFDGWMPPIAPPFWF